MPQFILDHNFPIQANALPWPPDIRLAPLEDYDARLVRDHEDWQVLTELARRGDVDGYITNDDKMLNLSAEMVALRDARLILVVTAGVGDDALAATGLLMTHLPEITRHEAGNTRARIYRLRPLNLGSQREDLQRILRVVADRQNDQIDRMIARERAKIRAWPGLR